MTVRIQNGDSPYEYCKIYVNAPMGRHALARIVGAAVGPAPSAFGSIDTSTATLDVRKNDDHDPHRPDDFGLWPYCIDITRNDAIGNRQMIGMVAAVLEALWGGDIDAVAACEFEDRLPGYGGHARRSPP